jgi:hypothetical protein
MAKHHIWLSGMLMFLCGAAHADDSPHVSITVDDEGDSIVVLLRNLGEDPVKIRTDYLVEPVIGDISFEFSRGGKVYSQTSHVHAELPGESGYTILAPGGINGFAFDKGIVSRMHSLPSGCYSAVVTFHDTFAAKFSAYEGALKSVSRRICVVSGTRKSTVAHP